jgi:allantoin racemase
MAEIDSKFLGTQDIRSHIKILLLQPVPPPGEEEGPFSVSARGSLLHTTEVDEVYCLGAPLSYDATHGAEAAALVSPQVVARVKWAELHGYDAVVVNCMIDPGVAAAKKVARIPVIGIGETSRAVASLLGNQPAALFPDGICVLELALDEETTYTELLKAGHWLVAKRGVDVLIPDCAYIGGLAYRLQSELGVPVLPNVDVGLKMAELIATLNVRPEQPWVAGRRASKLAQTLSRLAWQLKRWTPGL